MTHQWHREFVEAARSVRTWNEKFHHSERGTADHNEAYKESRIAEKRLDRLIEAYDREAAGEPGLGL